jgi:hypothetical protein
MTTINVPLLTRVLDHITVNPKEWEQANWAVKTSCGTACCVAGHAAVMTGHTPDFSRGYGRTDMTSDGRLIYEVAQQELGLGADQADAMFAQENTLHDLWAMASEFTDGEIEIPASVTA